MIFDVNQAEAERKILELRAEFPASTICSKIVNITDDAAVTKAVVETVEELGSVDILLCFAGVVGCVHAIDMTGTEFKRVLDINTTGSFLCARAASNEMIKQGKHILAMIAASDVCESYGEILQANFEPVR